MLAQLQRLLGMILVGVVIASLLGPIVRPEREGSWPSQPARLGFYGNLKLQRQSSLFWGAMSKADAASPHANAGSDQAFPQLLR